MEYRSRFNYFGQTSYILLIGFLVIAFIIGVAINFQEMPERERFFMIYGGPFLLVVTILIWHKILTEINYVEITESAIKLKNLLTRKSTEIEKKNIRGFKDSFKGGGYKILLVDKNNKICGKIFDGYYKDFKTLIDKLGLEYLGKQPGFWDKTNR